MVARSATGGAKKSRSPSYPGISLDVAIQRSKKIYDREGRHAAPIAAIVGHWGYKPGTSSSNVSIAALKKFGLLVDEGSRETRLARLTDLALDILLNPEPAESVRKAALMPRIHQELYEKYGLSLPSDASLRHELIMTRSFTEAGADDFIAQFRKTLAFADLEGASIVDSERALPDSLPAVEPETAPATFEPQLPVTPAASAETVIPIPLVGGASVTISGQFPISEPAWQQFIAVLQAMKPGLVAGSSTDGGTL